MKDADNSEDDFFSNARVVIVGLGLMGGSLAKALHPHCPNLLGVDRDERVIEAALGQGVIRRGSTRAEEILPLADLVILAAPVRAIQELLERLPDLHPGNAILLDLGSTKRAVLGAMDTLPERFDPLGGHPMCGKEKLSFFESEAGLFQGAPFAFTPLPRTSEIARQVARQLCQHIGARAVWLSAVEHDRMVAATSHLPYLLSAALVQATPPDTSRLIGPGFKGMARLAATPSKMMLDVLATNRENVLAGLGRLKENLEVLSTLLRQQDEDSLREYLEKAAEKREWLLEEAQKSV